MGSTSLTRFSMYIACICIYMRGTYGLACTNTDLTVLQMCRDGQLNGNGVYLDTSIFTGQAVTCTCTMQVSENEGMVTFDPVVIDQSNCNTELLLLTHSFVNNCTSFGARTGFLPVNATLDLTVAGQGSSQNCLKVYTTEPGMMLNFTCFPAMPVTSTQLPTRPATTNTFNSFTLQPTSPAVERLCPSNLPVVDICASNVVKGKKVYLDSSLYSNGFITCNCSVRISNRTTGTINIYPQQVDSRFCDVEIEFMSLSYRIGCTTQSAASVTLSQSASLDMGISGIGPGEFCILVDTTTSGALVSVECSSGINTTTPATTQTTATTTTPLPTTTVGTTPTTVTTTTRATSTQTTPTTTTMPTTTTDTTKKIMDTSTITSTITSTVTPSTTIEPATTTCGNCYPVTTTPIPTTPTTTIPSTKASTTTFTPSTESTTESTTFIAIDSTTTSPQTTVEYTTMIISTTERTTTMALPTTSKETMTLSSEKRETTSTEVEKTSTSTPRIPYNETRPAGNTEPSEPFPVTEVVVGVSIAFVFILLAVAIYLCLRNKKKNSQRSQSRREQKQTLYKHHDDMDDMREAETLTLENPVYHRGREVVFSVPPASYPHTPSRVASPYDPNTRAYIKKDPNSHPIYF